MTTLSTKPCYACDTGTLRPTNLRGHSIDYRDEIGLVFDTDFTTLVCDTCGDKALQAGANAVMSETLERLRRERKRSAATSFLEVAERTYPRMTPSAWEEVFGLSRGYLSRLVSGSRTADTALEILLAGFAREPQMAMRLVAASGHLPAALTDLVATE